MIDDRDTPMGPQPLDLDKDLSGNPRLAERTARFCTEPWRRSEIDDLEAELADLVDDLGRPLDDETPLGGRTAVQVATEIQNIRRAMAAAMRAVRVRAMTSTEWASFQAAHTEQVGADGRRSDSYWDDLIAASAIAPTMTVDQVRALRARDGGRMVDEIALAAWKVNTSSGVAVPSSERAALVLRRAAIAAGRD